MRKIQATIGLLLAQAVLPISLSAQPAGPLQKSDLVRLLAGSRGATEPVVALVGERCLAFAPTARDRSDLAALGAGEELMAAIGGCEERRARGAAGSTRASASASRGPSPTVAAPVEVDRPAVLPVSLTPPEVAYGPPPATGSRRSAPAPVIDRPPALMNAHEVSKLLKEHYPPDLLRRGIGGTVVLRLLVDLAGRVVETEVAEPSSEPGLDEAAIRVAADMRFEPARVQETPISTWTRQPVVFTAR